MAELIEEALAVSGLLDHYRQERDGAERVENLEELVNAAASFVESTGANSTMPRLFCHTPAWRRANAKPARALTPCS